MLFSWEHRIIQPNCLEILSRERTFMKRTDKKGLNEPDLKPSLPITLTGQGRHCIHWISNAHPTLRCLFYFSTQHSEALLLMLIYCKAEKAGENDLQSK